MRVARVRFRVMALPHDGLSRDDVLTQLEGYTTGDVRWREGRAFTLAYNAGPDVVAIAEEAYRRFATENGLNTHAFPSLQRIQSEVVAAVAEWFHGGTEAAGFITSGGTESLLLTVKAARERGRKERGITTPNVVLPTSAHAALEKGCYYFGVESRRIPVGDDWRADVAAMEAAIDDDTVLVVGSAPQYPQGVVDPIEHIAALAAARGINCHVDACMGGVTLTYLERMGHPVQPWDFRVPGVTSISVDLHKYGYSAKGAGVLMHRTKQLRAYQTFVTDNWLGGVYGSSGVLGTKSGGPWAAAWAVMHHLGDAGYERVTSAARTACLELTEAIDAMPELTIRARPDTTLLAFGATHPDQLDVFAVADALWARGWYVDRQGPPASLHCTVNAVHEGRIAEFVTDLRAAVREAGGASGDQGAYGTVE
jgi:sphinganine-1-phosphate aldolase